MKNKGFTLIELLIVMMVMGLVAGFSISMSYKLNQTKSLETGYENYVAMLNQARSYAQSQVKTCAGTLSLYRVVLSQKVTGPPVAYLCSTLREICINPGANSLLQTYCLPPNVEFKEGTTTPIDFPIQGGSVTSDTVTIQDTSTNKQKDVTITSEGGVVTQ